MIKAPGTIIIAGTGRDSGKSSLAVYLISKFRDRHITAIKYSPHPHPALSGMTYILGHEGFKVYEEHNTSTGKDTARMLGAGAVKVFLVIAAEAFVEEAFKALQGIIAAGSPVICESPALRHVAEPDLFVIMKHENENHRNKKDIEALIPLADLVMTLNDINLKKADIIDLKNDNSWYLNY